MAIYEKFSKYYDIIYRDIVNYEKEIDLLERIFAKHCQKKPRDVLDLGCGTGSHALILAQRGYTLPELKHYLGDNNFVLEAAYGLEPTSNARLGEAKKRQFSNNDCCKKE